MNDEKRMSDRFTSDFGQETYDLNTEAGFVAFIKSLDPAQRGPILANPVMHQYAAKYRAAIAGLVIKPATFGQRMGGI